MDGVWTFKHLLPIQSSQIPLSFREGNTPVLELLKSSERLSVNKIYVKNEGQNPGGSIRDREMSVLFTYLQNSDQDTVVVESTGTLGIAAAMYSQFNGQRCEVVMPDNYPVQFKGECQLLGANVTLIPWNESNRSKVKQSIQTLNNVFDISGEGLTLRIEGAKTLFYEIFLQFQSSLPQVLLVPCGEGVTLMGIWKAITEFQKLDWLHKNQLPKIWIVQSHHCPSLALSDSEEEKICKDTIAFDLYNYTSPLHPMIVRLMKDNNWSLITVDDEDILSSWRQVASEEGLLMSPEGSACMAALTELVRSGKEKREQNFIIVNPSSGSRFIHSLGFIKRN